MRYFYITLTDGCIFSQVTGVVTDKDGKAHYVLSGTWDEKMEFSRVMQSSKGENGTEGKQRDRVSDPQSQRNLEKEPFTVSFLVLVKVLLNQMELSGCLCGSDRFYCFDFPERELRAGTSSPHWPWLSMSLRREWLQQTVDGAPDQRLMEDGRWDEANAEKTEARRKAAHGP